MLTLVSLPPCVRNWNSTNHPKRLRLIGQPLVGIEHGFDGAVEVAVVVLAEGVEHATAKDSASRPVRSGTFSFPDKLPAIPMDPYPRPEG